MAPPIHIGIDARVAPGAFGGVAEVLGLYARSLAFLDPAEFRFTLLCDRKLDSSWLRAVIPDHARILMVSDGDFETRKVVVPIRRNRLSETLFSLTAPVQQFGMPMQDASAIWRREGVDLVHLPFQFAIDSDLPTIYHPHDLQHIHLPDYFSRDDLIGREATYQYFCHRATYVACTSRWIAQDLLTQYDLSPERVRIVPWATTTGKVPEPDIGRIKRVLSRHGLVPDGYMLLPAQTWPHKNHLGAIRALDSLRRTHGLRPLLICTGSLNAHAQVLYQEIARLGLGDQVRFLGYVDRDDLSTLYQFARFTLIPTKFEAGSAPLWDAFTLGCPVTCATTTSLPSQSQGGAHLFDPDDIGQIAEAIRVMWLDADLRQRLAAIGTEAVKPYRWDMTARGFGVLYKQALGRPVSEGDQALMASLPVF